MFPLRLQMDAGQKRDQRRSGKIRGYPLICQAGINAEGNSGKNIPALLADYGSKTGGKILRPDILNKVWRLIMNKALSSLLI